MIDYIEALLNGANQTKEEYIEECKRCFIKEPKAIQRDIEESPTWLLESWLKQHRWILADWAQNYCKALCFELMLRYDFEEEIH